MTRIPVASSSISEVGHDSTTNTLEVKFANGGIYRYDGVTADHYDALLKAPSLGRHFQQHIRGANFKHTRIA